MKIETSGRPQGTNQHVQSAKSSKDASSSESFESILSSKTAKSPADSKGSNEQQRQVDFTNMTRQEMVDWMNRQIRNGRISLDETSSLLSMTMKVSVATGRPVDMATDHEHINFIERASQGIEWARSHNDQQLTERLQAAIELMQRFQGETTEEQTQAG